MTAFISCRKPLSTEEITSISQISHTVLKNTNLAANTSATSSLSTLGYFASTIAIVGCILTFSMYNNTKNNNIPKPMNTTNTSTENKTLKSISVDNKLSHLYVFKNQLAQFKDRNIDVQFMSPSKFTFTNTSLNISDGRAKITKTKTNKPLIVTHKNVTLHIDEAILEYSIRNDIVIFRVLSGKVKVTQNKTTKLVSKNEIWKSKVNNTIPKGILFLSPDKEDISQDKKESK